MKSWIIRFFGLRGSWSWAVRQLKKGRIIRPTSATGTIKYRLDGENQGRIMCTYSRDIKAAKWENAYIFTYDFERTDWVACGSVENSRTPIITPGPPVKKYIQGS